MLQIDIAGPDIFIVHLSGELDFAASADLIVALMAVEGPIVVVEMSNVTLVDSAGLRALVEAKQRIQSRGRHLEVQGAKARVRRIFSVTGTEFLLAGTIEGTATSSLV